MVGSGIGLPTTDVVFTAPADTAGAAPRWAPRSSTGAGEANRVDVQAPSNKVVAARAAKASGRRLAVGANVHGAMLAAPCMATDEGGKDRYWFISVDGIRSNPEQGWETGRSRAAECSADTRF